MSHAQNGPLVSRLLSLSAPVVIAHRGGSRLRPENTMLAFAHAIALGADAIECDVHLSRDGDVVVIHDATLERTTNLSGRVGDRTAAELSQADAGWHFGSDSGFPYRDQTGVPRLADVLTGFPDVPVVIEVKGEREETAHRALAVIAECDAVSRVVVGGFSHGVLTAVRRARPDIVTSASSLEVRSAVRRAYCWLAPRQTGWTLFQVPLRLRGRRVLTPRLVRQLRRAGSPVHGWIIDDPHDMHDALAWGVTGLITDRPDVALAQRDRHARR